MKHLVRLFAAILQQRAVPRGAPRAGVVAIMMMLTAALPIAKVASAQNASSDQNAIVIGAFPPNVLPLTGKISRLNDPETTLTLKQILTRRASDFKPVKGIPSSGYTRDAIWYRINLDVTHTQRSPLFLDIEPVYLNFIDIYVVAKGDTHPVWQAHLGDNIPASLRPLNLPSQATPLPALPKGAYSILIRTQSNSTQFLKASIKSELALLNGSAQKMALLGLLLGVMTILGLTYLLIGANIRDASVTSYGIFVLIFAFGFSNIQGATLVWFHPDWSLTNDVLTGVGTLLNLGVVVYLWGLVLELPRTNPWIWKVLKLVCALTFLASLSAPTLFYIELCSISSAVHSVILLSFVCLIVQRLLPPERDRIYWGYLLALVAPTVTIVIYLMAINNFIEITPLTLSLYPASIVFHLVLMSLLMAYRVIQLDRDQTKAAQTAANTNKIVQEQRKMISMLSHEFRTPLAVIQRAAEMVSLRLRTSRSNKDIPDAIMNRLQRIQDQSGKLARLVDVFLNKDSLEGKEVSLARKQITARAFLADFVSHSSRENALIEFSFEGDEDATLFVDSTLLGLAITNVVENGRRYAPGRPVALNAKVIDAGRNIRINIPYHWDKMNETALQQLRDSLFRSSREASEIASPNHSKKALHLPSIDAPVPQMALGLHISHRIVAAHGGRVEIRPMEAGGAILRIVLPLESDQITETFA